MLHTRPQLRVIHGGRYRQLRLGATRVVVTERPYGSPDAVLFEENTQLSMSGAPQALRVSAEAGGRVSPVGRSVRRGSVLVCPGRPAEMFLVVNRTGARSVPRPGWLEKAWEAAFGEAERRRLSVLVAPLIGCVGGAGLDTSLAAVAGVLSLRQYKYPRTLELACGELAEEAYAGIARHAHHIRH